MSADISPGKRLAFTAMAVLLVLAAIEIFSYVMCTRFIPSRVRSREQFKSPEDYIAAFTRGLEGGGSAVGGGADGVLSDKIAMFHSVLGWDFPPNVSYTDARGVSYRHGPLGERITCTSFPTVRIATYGDSFTYCSDVGDCETWQTYLGHALGANVINFGVPGYGTDQAFLKYEINSAGMKTPIVTLGILPDDINRMVNIFRTFYSPDDRVALTKPRYIVGKNGVRLVPNPIVRQADIVKLRDRRFVAELGTLDYWYARDMERPSVSFPYLLSLLRLRKTIAANLLHGLGFSAKAVIGRHYPDNLFEEAVPLALMNHVVDRFVETARARGSEPVIVLMAHSSLIREFERYGIHRMQGLIEHLRENRYAFVDLIAAMARMKPSEKTLDAWFREHATPEGNRVIAKILADSPALGGSGARGE